MGEAEDAIFGREQQANAISDDQMNEFRQIKFEIERLIPQVVANLRKHNYPSRNARRLDYRGEHRVGWCLRSDPEGFSIFVLGDGTLVQDISTQTDEIPYVPSPHSGWPGKVNQTVREVKEALQRLATTDSP